MARRMPLEATYYPAVQQCLKHWGFICESRDRKRRPIQFVMKGIGQIILDVFGVRAASSRYSTEIELAAVEVKRSTRRASLRAMHQALNNSKVAHYCYLAQPRRRYSEKQIAAAAELGIGLLAIGRTNRVRMISQSRRFSPSPALIRQFCRRILAIAQCSICHNFASLYDIPEGQHREGGGWRKNVFAPDNDRWVYFCKQCRERFENVFTERRMQRLEARLKTLEGKQKALKRRLASQ